MRTIVLYKSKYGSAKQYAEWIAEALDCKMAETGSVGVDELADCDCILIGGGIYAGGVKGLKWLKKNYSRLSGKRIAVFAVGASPYNKEDEEEAAQTNLQGELAGLPFFYLRGKWDEASMSVIDRKLCNMLKKSVEKKPKEELVGWEKALLEATAKGSGGSIDWTDKERLHDLLEWVNYE